MRTRTAAIENGVVVDVEVYDSSNPPADRPDSLPRTPCPEWVEAGCRYDGVNFFMPDGSDVPEEKLAALADADDHRDIRDRLVDLRPDMDALRTGTGTNGERIARLERFVHVGTRLLLRLTKNQ